jgi:hypothetical protein
MSSIGLAFANFERPGLLVVVVQHFGQIRQLETAVVIF